MKTIKYMGMALAIAALASCSSDDDFGANWQNDPTAVRVSASVGGVFTRSNPTATTEADQKKFNENDTITISTEGQTPVNYILKDGSWGPETPGQFLKWSSEPMTFTGHYPKGSGDFIVPTDQNGDTKIALADYMTATSNYDKIPADRKVNFTFSRQMARVVINIVGFNDEFSDIAYVPEIKVTSKEKISADGTEVTATSDITPYLQSGEGKKGSNYYALVAPNTATGYDFIKLKVKYGEGDNDTKSLVVKNPVALEKGKSYEYNLTIGKNEVSIGTVSVEDWGSTGTISGGEAMGTLNLTKGSIDITDDGYYVITTNGETTANTVTISGNATVKLQNAIISSENIGIDVKSGSPTIIVSGTANSVTSTKATAINVCGGATITIRGEKGTEDKLTATGGRTYAWRQAAAAGAGIGSSDGGNIVIDNVTIEATGGTGIQDNNPGSGGAGIGSSTEANCGDITITNAVITATGGDYAAAIGLGNKMSNKEPKMGNISIKKSTITATGGSCASVIGLSADMNPSGSTFTVGTINIETDKTGEDFLDKLTCQNDFSKPSYKIGKGAIYTGSSVKGLDGNDWKGATLKASDDEQTSTEGIGQVAAYTTD